MIELLYPAASPISTTPSQNGSGVQVSSPGNVASGPIGFADVSRSPKGRHSKSALRQELALSARSGETVLLSHPRGPIDPHLPVMLTEAVFLGVAGRRVSTNGYRTRSAAPYLPRGRYVGPLLLENVTRWAVELRDPDADVVMGERVGSYGASSGSKSSR